MTAFRLRPAERADLVRVHAVRTGVAENPLDDPAQVRPEEVLWYLEQAIFLVAEDEADIQGFVCANPQTGYVWALFVIDGMQGRGMGTALLAAAVARLRAAGNQQAHLTTGAGSRAETFYAKRGWTATGRAFGGEIVYRLWL